MEFKHVIITRFNLSKRWNKDKFGNLVLNSTWLKDRYQLFEYYCLPSIKSQTNQEFEWWVYFDKDLNDNYKSKNEKLNKEFSNFIPKYEESYDSFESNLPIELSKKLASEKIDWLITTRLDNDDILAIDTIETIKKHADFTDLCLLEIPVGYTLEIAKESVLREVTAYLNPFISLVEKVTENNLVKSVYYKEHNNWGEVPRHIVSNKPHWIQVIHNKNVSNRAVGIEVAHYSMNKRFKFNRERLIFKSLFKIYIKKINFFMTNKIKRKVKEFQDRLKNIDKKADENHQLIEDNMALNQLLKMFSNNVFIPLTSWSISPKEVLHICNDIVINNRKNIIEFGAGFSTICIAQLLKSNNIEASFFSVENNEKWAEELKNTLRKMKLEHIVNIIVAPIKEIEDSISKEAQRLWYDTEILTTLLPKEKAFDLVIVDGPTGHSTPYARYSAIPYLKEKIAKDFAIFLDDANRPHEEEIIADWKLIIDGKIKGYYRYCYISNNLDYDIAPFGSKF